MNYVEETANGDVFVEAFQFINFESSPHLKPYHNLNYTPMELCESCNYPSKDHAVVGGVTSGDFVMKRIVCPGRWVVRYLNPSQSILGEWWSFKPEDFLKNFRPGEVNG